MSNYAGAYFGSQDTDSFDTPRYSHPSYYQPYQDDTPYSGKYAYPEILVYPNKRDPASWHQRVPAYFTVFSMQENDVARKLNYSTAYIFPQLNLEAKFTTFVNAQIELDNVTHILGIDINGAKTSAFKLSGFKLSGNFSLSFAYTDDIEKNNFDKLTGVILCLNQGVVVVQSQLITGVTDTTNKKIVLTLQNSQMIDTIYMTFSNWGGYIGYKPGHCRLIAGAGAGGNPLSSAMFKLENYVEASTLTTWRKASSGSTVLLTPTMMSGGTPSALGYPIYGALAMDLPMRLVSVYLEETICATRSIRIRYYKYASDPIFLDASAGQTEFIVKQKLASRNQAGVCIIPRLKLTEQTFNTFISISPSPYNTMPNIYHQSVPSLAIAAYIHDGEYDESAPSKTLKHRFAISYSDTGSHSFGRVLVDRLQPGGIPAEDADRCYLAEVHVLPIFYLLGNNVDQTHDYTKAFLQNYFAES